MTSSLQPIARWRPLLLFGMLAALLVATEHTVVHGAAFGRHPALGSAVAFDLLVVLPALFYGCVVRPYRLPLSTLGAALGAGLALSHWLLPAGGLPLLAWAGRLAAVLEISALGYAAVRVRRLWHAYRAAQSQSADVVENLHSAARSVLGHLGEVLATELVLMRYALLGGWARPEVGPTNLAFSTYQKSGFVALLATAGGLSLLEMAAAHLVVGHWYPRVAWGLTVLSIYALLWLLAHGQAVRRRPVLLSSAALVVRAGMVWRATISLDLIASVQVVAQVPKPVPSYLNTARLLLTEPNLLLTFAEPQVVHGLYGLRRTVCSLAIYVDEPGRLMQHLGRPAQAPPLVV